MSTVQPEPPRCGVPCPNGGLWSQRRSANVDLQDYGVCNRRVKHTGDRCWQHPTTADVHYVGGVDRGAWCGALAGERTSDADYVTCPTCRPLATKHRADQRKVSQ